MNGLNRWFWTDKLKVWIIQSMICTNLRSAIRREWIQSVISDWMKLWDKKAQHYSIESILIHRYRAKYSSYGDEWISNIKNRNLTWNRRRIQIEISLIKRSNTLSIMIVRTKNTFKGSSCSKKWDREWSRARRSYISIVPLELPVKKSTTEEEEAGRRLVIDP